MKVDGVVFDICERTERQTDRQSDILIIRGEVIKFFHSERIHTANVVDVYLLSLVIFSRASRTLLRGGAT